jgi:N-hydroxyarylamine O-acetyltransferase
MLKEQLTERVSQKLGLSARPKTDLAGLREVYGAWCRTMNFDNLAKVVALRTNPQNHPLPGIDGTEFFERWLAHGVGGTCWTSSNALFELVDSLGFDARRVAGSMRDTGIVSHGSVKVKIDGSDWLLDSSMLTGIPLPLTKEVFVSDDPVFQAEVEPVDGTYIIWADLPPNATYLPCRLLVDPATHDFYVERWEASRGRSPFNQRLYARRNADGAMLVLNATTRLRKTAAGVESTELNASQICESLRNEFGVSGDYIDLWEKSGALDASFEPSQSPPPVPITQKPPSQRESI